MSTHATTYGDGDIDQVETSPRGPRALGAGDGPYCIKGTGVGVGTLEEHLKSPSPIKTMPRNKLVHLFLEALARMAEQERQIKTLREHLHGRRTK